MARWQPSERNARYRKRRNAGFPSVVSEGDSWFDYPFYKNTIDLIDDAELFAHHRLEASGDTVKGMIGTAAAVNNLRTIIEHERPICVLFSGGGNDLAAAATKLFCLATEPPDCLDGVEMTALFDRLAASYADMIGAIGPIAPIFAHGYDYFAPSAAPVKFVGIETGIGPWIFPSMIAIGLQDEALRRAVAHILVDRFNDMLRALAATHPLDFVHIDLRGTLDIDADWQNEIHPTRPGFRKVASALQAKVVNRLPGLLSERLAARLGPAGGAA